MPSARPPSRPIRASGVSRVASMETVKDVATKLSAKEHGRVGQWHLEQAVLQVLQRSADWCTAQQVSRDAGLYWSDRENFRLVHTVLNKLWHERRVEYQAKDRYRLSR